MSEWARMRFRDQDVWVKVDGGGKPVLDADGRAEMKYRQDDQRSYRPSPGNLGASSGAPAVDPPRRPSSGTRKPAAAAKAAAPASAETIHVWTDGACTGNPGPMGIGVVVLAQGGTRRELGEYLGIGTNNIAELTAVERGLALAETIDASRTRPVRVYTDSAYSIGVLSLSWKAKANQELVARIKTRLRDFPDLVFVKVRGHAGVPENERCDELARKAVETRGRA